MMIKNLQPGDLMKRRRGTLEDQLFDEWNLIVEIKSNGSGLPRTQLKVLILHTLEETAWIFESDQGLSDNTWLAFFRDGELLT